jgi:hypothetical protein
MAKDFSLLDIQPFQNNTEFSPFPSFHVTNDIATAFEFPLHNHLAKNSEDIIVVFCFELDLGILHGNLPPPSKETFKVMFLR